MSVNTTIERIVYEGIDALSGPSKQAAKGVADLRQALDAVKNVLGALGVTAAAGAMVSLYLDTLKATAALDDMAEATGASVEGLSAIQRVAKIGGHDFEGLTGQIGKMIKGLKDGGDEGSKTAAALDHLGIRSRDVNGQWRDTSAILIEVAQKLKNYATDGAQVQFVQDALGKGAERYLPLLKDIGEGTDLHATVTREQAAAAEEAEKNINRLKVGMEDARREMVNEFTPAVINLTNQLLAAQKASGGFWSGMASFFSVSGAQAEDPLASLEEVSARLGRLRTLRDELDPKKASSPDQSITRSFNEAIWGDLYNVQAQIALAERQESVLRELLQRRVARNTAGMVEDVAGIHPAPAAERLNYQSRDAAAENRERDFVARQLQEGVEEEQRILSEAGQWTAFYRNKQIEDEKKAADARIQAMIDFYDREEQLAIEEGAILAQEPTHSARLDALKQALGIEEELEREAYERRLEELQAFSDAELEQLGGRQAISEQLEREHQDRVSAIHQQAWESRVLFAGLRGKDLLAINQYIFGALAAQMSSKSRTMFEIGKAAAIAETTISTIASAQKIFESMSKFGPFVAYPAAAAAYAAGILRVQQIRSTQFGGGASAGGAAPVYNAVPGTGVPTAPTTPAPTASTGTGGQSQIVVNLSVYGSVYGDGGLAGIAERELVPVIRDLVDNRDVILIGPNSRQAIDLKED